MPNGQRLRVSASSLAGREDNTLRVDPSDGINPDEAAVLAVLLNPELVAARDEHGEARAQLLTAGLLPNPVLDVEYAHPYGSGSEGTNDVLNVALSWDLKPLFARSARKASADANLARVDLGVAWQELQVAQQARLLVVRLQWLRERVKLARVEMDFEGEAAQALDRASQDGDATLGQLGVQRAALESARHTLQELEQTTLAAESELLALLGNPRLEKLVVAEAELDVRVEAPNLATCLHQRLDLQAFQHAYRAEEASLRAAALDQFPDISIGISHQHDESSLDFIGAFVSVGLPVFDRNQGNVELVTATRRRLQHEYDARIAEVRADLTRLERYSKLLQAQLPAVGAAIAALEEIESEERAAVARGDLDQPSYQAVRSALLEQRLQQAAMLQALAETRVGLDAACGTRPVGGTSPR